MRPTQSQLSRSMGAIFIGSSIIFNISVSVVYIAVKLGDTALMQVFGAVSVLLILPFSITLWGFVKDKVEKRRILSVLFILFYLFLELFLDYILIIPFREILALHVFYIIVFYIAAFNMVGVSFSIDRRMGFVVLVTFMILIGCLMYLYFG